MMKPRLADPLWTDSPDLCVSCCYDLRGLAAPGRCPECGCAYEQTVLVLSGVVRTLGAGSPARRSAWIAVIALGAIVVNGYGLLFLYSWRVGAAMSLCFLAGLALLLATSRLERAGAERFVITPSGITRQPIDGVRAGKPGDSFFIPFAGLTTVRLDRVGPLWRRLRLGVAPPRSTRLRNVVFDAGIRCPNEWDARVQATLSQLIADANTARHS